MSEVRRMDSNGRMSKIVVHKDTIYLCGQTADNTDESVGPQTENMLAKVDALLEKAGSSREHMLSATIYLRDIKDADEMNRVWDAWVPKGNEPARACVEARMVRPNLLVEISVVAAVKG